MTYLISMSLSLVSTFLKQSFRGNRYACATDVTHDHLCVNIERVGDAMLINYVLN